MNRKDFEKIVSQYVDLKTNELFREPKGEIIEGQGYVTLEFRLLYIEGIKYQSRARSYFVYSTQDRMFIWDAGHHSTNTKMGWCIDTWNKQYPHCQFVEREYPLSGMASGRGWSLGSSRYIIVDFKSPFLGFINWTVDPFEEVKE